MPTMSTTTKEAFDYFRLDVATLHAVWLRIFRPLFAVQENITILNSAAPNTFNFLLGSLLDSVCLALTRLADPAKSMNKANMCLEQLINTLDPNADKGLIGTLTTRLEQFRQKCQPFRERRNHWTAHRDMKTVQNLAITPAPGFSRAQVEEALGELRGFMNEVQGYFENAGTVYEETTLIDDGNTLMNLLKKGVEAQKEEDKRFLDSLENGTS